MSWISEKFKNLSADMKIGLWVCASFFFIALIVLVIVFFVLTPMLVARLALPLSSILCSLLMVPTMLCLEKVLHIVRKRDFNKQLSEVNKASKLNEAVREKDKEISSLKTELAAYKKMLDDTKTQLDNQIASPLEIQNITIEDRHILCTIPIVTEKFYDSTITKEELEAAENIELDKLNWLNIFNPMEDIEYRNVIVMQHKAFPQISISYKKIFVESQGDDTLCVYGVIPEVVSKSIEQGEEHIVKFNEMIKMYNRLDKPHAKIVSDEALFEKLKTLNKEKYINDFNNRLTNGLELTSWENVFTAMAQEHIRRFLLSRVPNKQIKFVNRYYNEIESNGSIGNARPFVDFMHSEQKQLLIGN